MYFDECPNWKIAAERLAVIAVEREGTTVTRKLVTTAEEAEKAGFYGSPSILADGADVFADATASVGLACRRYVTPDGLTGSPTLNQLRASLSPAQKHVPLQ